MKLYVLLLSSTIFSRKNWSKIVMLIEKKFDTEHHFPTSELDS